MKVKAVTNLDSELKSRDTTLLTKVCIVKVMVFPIFMYRGESWAIDKYLDFRSTRLNLFEKKKMQHYLLFRCKSFEYLSLPTPKWRISF